MVKKSKTLITCKELSILVESLAKQMLKDATEINPVFEGLTYELMPIGGLLKWLEVYSEHEIQRIPKEVV